MILWFDTHTLHDVISIYIDLPNLHITLTVLQCELRHKRVSPEVCVGLEVNEARTA